MNAVDVGILVCSTSMFLAAIVIFYLGIALRVERRRRQDLEQWLRGNLFVIRATCASTSEEAVSVVHSLECALPVLARVDAEGLERRLYHLRSQRDARLLRGSGQDRKAGAV